MSNSTSNNENTSRWWEFYVVRYGMGTVVGAVIVFLLFKISPAMAPMLFQAGKKENASIDGSTLALLAGYGLAYCYLASAPILVFHSCRHTLFDDRKINKYLLSVILAIVALCFGAIFACTTLTEAQKRLVIGGSILMILVLFQLFGIVSALSQHGSRRLFHFYKRLTNAREQEMTSIVESYRHLREHGNSFLIVFFEVVLAIILLFFSHASDNEVSIYLFAAITIWILPAALIWVVGTRLEYQFLLS